MFDCMHISWVDHALIGSMGIWFSHFIPKKPQHLAMVTLELVFGLIIWCGGQTIWVFSLRLVLHGNFCYCS